MQKAAECNDHTSDLHVDTGDVKSGSLHHVAKDLAHAVIQSSETDLESQTNKTNTELQFPGVKRETPEILLSPTTSSLHDSHGYQPFSIKNNFVDPDVRSRSVKCDDGDVEVPEANSMDSPCDGDHNNPDIHNQSGNVTCNYHTDGTINDAIIDKNTVSGVVDEDGDSGGQNAGITKVTRRSSAKRKSVKVGLAVLNYEDKLLWCSECGKTFAKRSQLNIHQRMHSGEKPFSCSECGKKFKQRGHLKTHYQVHSTEKPFFCTRCQNGFTTRSSLKRHELTHLSDTPLYCTDCGKAFSTGSRLKVHQRIHSGLKPLSCRVCGKVFARPSSLKEHEVVHSSEAPFCCADCGKPFSWRASLRRHNQFHCVKKTIPCPRCKKRFSTSSGLERHEIIHSDINT